VIPDEKQSDRPAARAAVKYVSLATVIDEGLLSSQAPNGAWEILAAAMADAPTPLPLPTPESSREVSRCEEIRAGLQQLAARYRRRLDCRRLEGRRHARL
jgi:hypothetical protein